MIGQLPLFLAVGFCLGLFASPGVVLFFLALQGDGGWRVFLGWAILLSLATLAGVALLRAVDDPGIGLGLQFAALVVGAAGGRWFATASAERDKAVFVAAAGLFLAIAAIEYDYRLFGYLNKFSAGGVDLEFAGPASDKGGDTRVAGASTGPKNDPFSGRNRLNIAIKKLEQLPDFARRDEKYARMFSGYDAMLGKYRLTAPAPEPASKQYQDFYGQFVLPFVQTLEMLHDFHQGEISGISLDTDVIFALRKLYESTLFLAPPNGEASPRLLAGGAASGASLSLASFSIWRQRVTFFVCWSSVSANAWPPVPSATKKRSCVRAGFATASIARRPGLQIGPGGRPSMA